MLIFVTGPDAFLVREAVRRIRTEHDPDGFNTSVFDAREIPVDEILGALQTPSFFGVARVVVVHDLISALTKPGATGSQGTEGRAKGADRFDWGEFFRGVQSNNVGVFVENELTTVPAPVKRSLPEAAQFISSEAPRGAGLITWIRERAGECGSSIADADARVLAELITPGTWNVKPSNPAYDRPPDLDRLAGEVEKLALFARPEPITRSDIRALTAEARADRLFTLLDALVAGDRQTALQQVGQTAGDEDDTSRTINQVAQQAELLAASDAARAIEPSETGRRLGLSNPARMQAIGRSLSRLSNEPSGLISETLLAERQFKSGELRRPVDHLYALIERWLESAPKNERGRR